MLASTLPSRDKIQLLLNVCAKVAKIPQISVSLPSDLSEFMYY